MYKTNTIFSLLPFSFKEMNVALLIIFPLRILLIITVVGPMKTRSHWTEMDEDSPQLHGNISAYIYIFGLEKKRIISSRIMLD